MYGGGKKPSKPKTQKQSQENIIKGIKNLFKLKKEKKAIKDRIIRDTSTIFEQQDNFYKSTSAGNFWNKNCTEDESKGDRDKKLSVKEYLNKIKLSLRNIIFYFENSGTWKIELTTAINFISSKDVDEEHVMHSKSNDKEFIISDNTNHIVDDFFESLLSRYLSGLETSIRVSDFIFDSVQFLLSKCNKTNFRLD